MNSSIKDRIDNELKEIVVDQQLKNKILQNIKNNKRSKNNSLRFVYIAAAATACIAIFVTALVILFNMQQNNGSNVAINTPTQSEYNTTPTPEYKIPEAYAQKLCSYAYKLSDWIYYVNEDDNGYIYRIKTDGTENTKLSDRYCSNFKIADEWIYFNAYDVEVDGSDEWGYQVLYKMRLDGSDFTEIPLNYTGDFEVLDGNIYYIYIHDYKYYGGYSNWSQLYAIYKMNLDGTGKTKLTQNVIIREYDGLKFNNGYIYYNYFSEVESNVSLFRIKLDGSENQKVVDEAIDFDSDKILGDWIYYIDNFNHNKRVICRININSGQEQTIIEEDDHLCNFAVYKESVYYVSLKETELNKNNNQSEPEYEYTYIIKKVNVDGTDKRKLTDIGNGDDEINIADNYIYFTDQDENGIDGLFKISVNGFEKQKVQLSDESINTENNKTNSNESEGWLFFVTDEGEGFYGSIHKIRTSGKDYTKISTDKDDYNMPNMQIVGDKIYYGSSGIWSCDLNGKNRKLICSKSNQFKIFNEYILNDVDYGLIRTDLNGKNEVTLSVNDDFYLDECIVFNEWIYYIPWGDENKNLYKISMDGKNKTKLTDNKKPPAQHYTDCEIYNNALYYTLGNGDFCKLDLSNDKLTKLFNINTSNFTISGDIVYFSNDKDNGYLYKINLSGGRATKIRNHTVSNIIVAGDVIYYINAYNHSLYRINIDGRENKRITDHRISSFEFIPD